MTFSSYHGARGHLPALRGKRKGEKTQSSPSLTCSPTVHAFINSLSAPVLPSIWPCVIHTQQQCTHNTYCYLCYLFKLTPMPIWTVQQHPPRQGWGFQRGPHEKSWEEGPNSLGPKLGLILLSINIYLFINCYWQD